MLALFEAEAAEEAEAMLTIRGLRERVPSRAAVDRGGPLSYEHETGSVSWCSAEARQAFVTGAMGQGSTAEGLAWLLGQRVG